MSLDFNAPSITFNATKLYKLDFDKYSPSAEVQNIIQHIWPRDCTSLEKLQNTYHLEIESIHKVKNEFRAKLWSVVEDEMREKGYVKHTFMHGTKTDALDTIFKFDFNPSFGTRAMIGKGVYCSPKLLEALGYGYNIIVCEVFLGNTGVGEGKEGLPPAALGFDSTQTRDGSIVCIGDPAKFMMSVALVRFRRNYHRFKLPVAGGAAASVKAPVVPVAQLAAVPAVGLPGFGQALVSNAPLVSSAAASGAGGAGGASGASGGAAGGSTKGATATAAPALPVKKKKNRTRVYGAIGTYHGNHHYTPGVIVLMDRNAVDVVYQGILSTSYRNNRSKVVNEVSLSGHNRLVVEMLDQSQYNQVLAKNIELRKNANNRPLRQIVDGQNNNIVCTIQDHQILAYCKYLHPEWPPFPIHPSNPVAGAAAGVAQGVSPDAVGSSSSVQDNVLNGRFGGSGSAADPVDVPAPVDPAAQSPAPVTDVQDKGKGPAIELIEISDSDDDYTGSPLKRTRIGDV